MTMWSVFQDFKGEKKSMKQKSGFFEKINKISKPLIRQRKKREGTHCEYLKWNRGHQYRPCRQQKDNNRTLWTTPHINLTI